MKLSVYIWELRPELLQTEINNLLTFTDFLLLNYLSRNGLLVLLHFSLINFLRYLWSFFLTHLFLNEWLNMFGGKGLLDLLVANIHDLFKGIFFGCNVKVEGLNQVKLVGNNDMAKVTIKEQYLEQVEIINFDFQLCLKTPRFVLCLTCSLGRS